VLLPSLMRFTGDCAPANHPAVKGSNAGNVSLCIAVVESDVKFKSETQELWIIRRGSNGRLVVPDSWPVAVIR
jgi:hypothetical protein